MRKIIQLSAADAATLANYSDWGLLKQNADGSVFVHTVNSALLAKAVQTLPHFARSASSVPPNAVTALGAVAPTGTVADFLTGLFGEGVLDLLR